MASVVWGRWKRDDAMRMRRRLRLWLWSGWAQSTEQSSVSFSIDGQLQQDRTEYQQQLPSGRRLVYRARYLATRLSLRTASCTSYWGIAKLGSQPVCRGRALAVRRRTAAAIVNPKHLQFVTGAHCWRSAIVPKARCCFCCGSLSRRWCQCLSTAVAGLACFLLASLVLYSAACISLTRFCWLTVCESSLGRPAFACLVACGLSLVSRPSLAVAVERLVGLLRCWWKAAAAAAIEEGGKDDGDNNTRWRLTRRQTAPLSACWGSLPLDERGTSGKTLLADNGTLSAIAGKTRKAMAALADTGGIH